MRFPFHLNFRAFENFRSFTFVALFLLPTFLGGCATHYVQLERTQKLARPEVNAQVTVSYTDENEWDAHLVMEAIRHAIPRIEKWGRFRHPVEIRIYPTHELLERSARRKGYDWLRGWARYDHILLQAPSTWGGGRLEARVKELITHELTHVLMYQLVAEPHNWHTKYIPFWFREGMASTTAEQGHFRLTKEQISRYYLGNQYAGDPVSDAETLAKTHPGLVYSVSHWMFHDLMKNQGLEKIRGLMASIRKGKDFRAAWFLSLEEPLTSYEESWRDGLTFPSDKLKGSAGDASNPKEKKTPSKSNENKSETPAMEAF